MITKNLIDEVEGKGKMPDVIKEILKELQEGETPRAIVVIALRDKMDTLTEEEKAKGMGAAESFGAVAGDRFLLMEAFRHVAQRDEDFKQMCRFAGATGVLGELMEGLLKVFRETDEQETKKETV